MCPRRQVKRCCFSNVEAESDDEDIVSSSSKITCCLDDEDANRTSKCVVVHHTCLSYVFPRLMDRIVDKTDKQQVLLIARRPVPKSRCHRVQVYSYLTLMAVLTVAWFVATLLEQMLDHSAVSCNEIRAEDEYYVCFDHSKNWSIVDCQTFQVNRSMKVLCYTYSITPTAFGIAFSMASFVSTVISITFHSATYCSDERCSRTGLIIIQFLFLLAIVCCAVSLGVLYTTDEMTALMNYFLDDRSPLRSVFFILFGVSVMLGSCLPWCPFRSKRKYINFATELPVP